MVYYFSVLRSLAAISIWQHIKCFALLAALAHLLQDIEYKFMTGLAAEFKHKFLELHFLEHVEVCLIWLGRWSGLLNFTRAQSAW